MHFLLHENVVDLGVHGLLTITTEYVGRSTPSLPAQRFGYARWHDTRGDLHDRLDCCTRPVAEADIRHALERSRKAVTGSSHSRDRLDWLEGQLDAGYRQLPQFVGDFGDGSALLLFSGAIRPDLLRVVDIPSAAVLVEETADDLIARCGMRVPDYLRDYGLVLYASGNAFAHVAVCADFRLFRYTDHRLEVAKPEFPVNGSGDLAMSATHFYLRDRGTGRILVAPQDGNGKAEEFKPAHGRKGYTGIAAAACADRFVMASESGVILVIDSTGHTIAALRLVPLVAKAQFDLTMSPDGRYVLAKSWEHAWVVDIDQQMQAAVDTLLPSCAARERTTEPTPTIDFAPASRMVAAGLAVVHNGKLHLTPYSRFDWQPALPAKAARRSQPPAYKALLETWRKPAIALRPTKGKSCSRTHLYGLADLPANVAPPSHEGIPMVPLCQIDLSEIAGIARDIGLPDHGLLEFFVAENDDGEVLNEEFNPISTKVLWHEDADSTQPSPNTRAHPSLSLKAMKDRADLPAADAAIVQAQGLADHGLAEYQSFLESRFPDGLPSGHRLGGYPTLVQQTDPAQLATDLADDGREAKGWRLLLQLNSDDEFMWGTDSGMLYFMIHEDDLARGDFSQVQAFCEGY